MKMFIRVTDWERASLWRRIPFAFARVAILLFLLGTAMNLLGPPIIVLVATRWMDRRSPELEVVPRPLSEGGVSDNPGTTLSYFGYEFEVPWESNINKTNLLNGFVQIRFESGRAVTFIVPEKGLLTEIVQDESLKMKYLQSLWADLLTRSAYDQYAAVLNMTPRNIRAFGSRSAAARGESLLVIKALAFAPGLKTGVFSFEFPKKHGFQIGDPQKSTRVDLEIFDAVGRHAEIILIIWRGNASLTQSEINRIITSFRANVSPPSLAPSSYLTALPH